MRKSAGNGLAPLLVVALLQISGCGWMGSLNPFGSSEPQMEEVAEVEAGEIEAAAARESAAKAGDAEELSAVVADEETQPRQMAARRSPGAGSAGDAARSGTSTVEVLWKVPPDNVEKYHIYYGDSAEELAEHVEVSVTDLKQVDHPQYGPVYRYKLRRLAADEALYISLRAENRFGLSEPTTPTRIEAGQSTVMQ